MIDSALIFINRTLNEYLKNTFHIDEDMSVLNSLVDQDGSVPQKNRNKIVLTLINLEHETTKQFYGGVSSSQSRSSQFQPSVHFNLDLLISANFDSYDEALKFLTAIITFLQASNAFTRQNMPDLPEKISALKFEIENSPYTTTHNLWSALGAKYQPSIIYKIRHVTVQADQIQGTVPNIKDLNAEASPL